MYTLQSRTWDWEHHQKESQHRRTRDYNENSPTLIHDRSLGKRARARAPHRREEEKSLFFKSLLLIYCCALVNLTYKIKILYIAKPSLPTASARIMLINGTLGKFKKSISLARESTSISLSLSFREMSIVILQALCFKLQCS